jgi:GH35 family endo-1,4-beta-xylanase
MKKQLFFSSIYAAILLLSISISSNGQTLRQIAESKGKYIGNLMKDGLIQNNSADNNAPRNILSGQFNMLVTENAMKMENVIPNRPANPFNIQQAELNLGNINNFVAFANLYNMRKRGHTLLWYSQAPLWLRNEAKNWSAQQIRDFMRSYIRTLGTYCRGKINEWDVANEMLESSYNGSNYRTQTDGTPSDVWYVNIGNKNNIATYNTAVYNLIKDCFTWIREVDPEAELFYNDYSVENRSWPKAVACEALCRNLNSQGAPIDGVGFQTHFQTTNLTDGTVAGVVTNIKEYAKSNLNVHLTELDIRQNGATINGTQAHDGYYNLVRSCFLEPNCTGILIWGIRDNDSWIPGTFGAGVAPYLLYNSSYGQNGSYSSTGVLTKGAWTGVRDGMAGLANSAFPAASLVGNGNPGTVVTGGGGNKTYTVRARGVAGGEQIQLQVGGVVKATWTLTTAFQNYSVLANAGTVRVAFINDGGTRDAIIDNMSVGATLFQSENQAVNTGLYANGRCGGGGNSETMNCNGYIEYAGSATAARVGAEAASETEVEALVIAPNPAESLIKITVASEFVGGKLAIFDQTGRERIKSAINQTELEINVTDLTTGFYITNVVSKTGKTISKKLLKK